MSRFISQLFGFAPPLPDKRTLDKKRVTLELEVLENRIAPAIQVNVGGDAAPPPGFTTLRTAIVQANLSGGNVTITFKQNVGGQTIGLQSALPALTANITINNTTGSGIDVKGSGPAQNPYRVFQVAQGSTSSLVNLTISNGFVSGSNGGCISNAGTLTLQEDTITGGTASSGNGGGIFNQGTLNVSDCQLTNNTASPNQNGGSGLGGAVCNSGGTVTISGGTASAIKSNQATLGAGIYSAGGQLSIYETQITNNTASSNGGGVYISGGGVTMIADTIGSNFGAIGGGVYQAKGNVKLSSCSINTNTAKTGSGGGLLLLAGTLTITGGSIIGNKALSGNGGGVADYAGAFGNLSFTGGVTFKSNSVGNTTKTSGGTIVAGAGGGLYVVKGSLVNFNGCSFTNDKAATGSGVAVENLPQNIYGWPTVTDKDDPNGAYVPVK